MDHTEETQVPKTSPRQNGSAAVIALPHDNSPCRPWLPMRPRRSQEQVPETANGEMIKRGQHRCTRCINASNHLAPNARLNNDNAKTRCAEMCTILDAPNLLPPLLGGELIEDRYSGAQFLCFKQRFCVA
ncbi:hypothetical protein PR003_g21042 [Phytophthora rubi]|uniref:Uncharacterized protein n=1 Tax=Phytophthora rubi TaxID=129364 RepID=A0A6A4DGY6_9STRA|nr:hypothetical protein PR002_g19983 [Phytophthora rubi]KAE8996943.1 hypothetical protein PR001_g19719 [Phytophthora rubi]KAE9307264.1 hypothetical protein PR003_g21042 [Phytophthora rubi]